MTNSEDPNTRRSGTGGLKIPFEKLSVEERLVFALRFVAELPPEETADVINRGPDAIVAELRPYAIAAGIEFKVSPLIPDRRAIPVTPIWVRVRYWRGCNNIALLLYKTGQFTLVPPLKTKPLAGAEILVFEGLTSGRRPSYLADKLRISEALSCAFPSAPDGELRLLAITLVKALNNSAWEKLRWNLQDTL